MRYFRGGEKYLRKNTCGELYLAGTAPPSCGWGSSGDLVAIVRIADGAVVCLVGYIFYVTFFDFLFRHERESRHVSFSVRLGGDRYFLDIDGGTVRCDFGDKKVQSRTPSDTSFPASDAKTFEFLTVLHTRHYR